MLTTFNCEKFPLQFLVSGHNDIRYIDLWNQTSKIFYNKHTSMRGISSYYGMTFDPNKEVIYAIGSPVNSITPEDTRSKLLKIDKQGNLLEDIKIDSEHQFGQAHEIKIYDDKLFICDTRRNCIRIWDLITYKWDTFYPNPDRKNKDLDHINSITFYDRDRVVILAHGLLKPSDLLIFTYPDFNLIHKYPCGLESHNCFFLDNGTMLICSSKEENIRDISNSEIFLRIEQYPRGLFQYKNYLFVGKSQIACRDWRSKCNGEIEIFDLSTKSSIGCIIIQGIGQIYEVLSI